MYLIDTELKQLVININSSLYCYDGDGYSYLKRSPTSDLENVTTLRQFIECRLNLELYYIPELTDKVKYFDGHLFVVTRIDHLDEKKRRFGMVYAEIDETGQYFIQDPDGEVSKEKLLSEIKEILGGSRISFGFSQKKIKLNIE